MADSDAVDIADVVRTLRIQWRAFVVCFAVCVLGATAIVLFAPRRYTGKASVLARSAGGAGASVLGRMQGVGELLSGVGGLGGGGSIETELQLLRSRALAEAVVDTLQLQFRVRKPQGIPPSRLVAAHALHDSFDPRTYEFVRDGAGRYVVGGDTSGLLATPGQPVVLDVGSITLQASGLPPAFTLTILDNEDAITVFGKRLEATKAGGDVAKILYRGDDAVTAAAGANLLVRAYLERRRTVDRGVNARRVEYVTAQVDSTATQLAHAERELKRQQERSGVFDPELTDEAQLTSAAKVREQLIQFQVDEAALRQLLAQADRGALSSLDLAAYPSFIRGSSVSPLASQLTELEVTKTRLLERRTERDPEVLALDRSMATISAAIASMARSYADATTRQRVHLQQRLDSMQQVILNLPSANERVGRLKRDVLRLTQLYAALQAQLVEARLGAIDEGGQVRQIDVAARPRRPSFPQPVLTMGLGTAGGVVLGIIAALMMGWFGRWLRDPVEVERVAGITAERFEPNTPLLVGGVTSRTMLIVPLNGNGRSRATQVTEGLARTATARSMNVTILDLTAGGNGRPETSVQGSIERMERERGDGSLVLVQLPGLSSETTLGAMHATRPVLLVAPPGPVNRTELEAAVGTLRRLDVPCAGVVMSEAERRVSARGA